MKTNRDVEIKNWGGSCKNSFTVPKGTRVMIVGGHGGGYAVADERDAAEICGDKWDATVRYIFVPEDAVDTRIGV